MSISLMFVPVISAAGTYVMGLMIFKGKYFKSSWLGTKGNPLGL